MKRLSRGIISFGFSLVLIGALWGSEASPAMAGGGTFYVGSCHKGGFSDISLAVNAAQALGPAAHKSIVICKGIYPVSSPILVATNNLRITGKKGAVITTPAAYTGNVFSLGPTDHVTIQGLTFLPGATFTGSLVEVASSTHFIVQRLTIDGQDHVGPNSNAISISTSSGKVQKNRVLNWHEVFFTTTNGPIRALGSGVEALTISGNTITDYYAAAISAENVGSLVATGNRITGTGVYGISVVGVPNGGRISGNRITFDSNTISIGKTGLGLLQSSNFRVSGNRLTFWGSGIVLDGACTPANNNRITGNQIRESTTGIALYAESSLTCDTHVDHTTITGNRIINKTAFGGPGIRISTLNLGSTFISTAENEVVRRNTISHFGYGVIGFVSPSFEPLPDPANHITGVFAPNKYKPN